MRYLRFVLVPLLAALAACAPLQERPDPASAVAPEARAPVTILVSIDGFRPDYLDRGVTPNLNALARGGIVASMKPSFPSKTFPNHWAIVTGDRPDRSGIVANMMEDAAKPKDVFTMATDDPFWWNAAEPIWVTAEKAGVRTATMFWPGASVAWGGAKADTWPYAISGGTRPHDWQQFSQVITSGQRVDAIIDWLRRPADTRPRFLTLYFDTVDTAGHVNGPNAQATTDAVAALDLEFGRLVDGLRALGQPANLVIVADHGMAATSSERVIALDGIADPSLYRIVESGPYASLVPTEGKEKALEAKLLQPHDHMACWRKAEIPARFHYGTNPRIPPYFCLADDGWLIQPTKPAASFTGGNHGYDNDAPDMAALFLANGPAFKAGTKLPSGFDNVDVYPLLAKLIGVQPVPGDGNPAVLDGLVTAP